MNTAQLRDALLETTITAGDLRAAILDMVALMPANRYVLLRPTTQAVIEELAPAESDRQLTNAVRGRVTHPGDRRLKVNRAPQTTADAVGVLDEAVK